MSNPDRKPQTEELVPKHQFRVELQNPEEIFQAIKQRALDPQGGGKEGIVSAEIGCLTSETGLFSRITTDLTLYYPFGPNKHHSFDIRTFAEYQTSE